MAVWYVYPLFKHVSFSVISERHVAELKKYMRVDEIDEYAFPLIGITSRPTVILHPYFYPLQRYRDRLIQIRHKLRALIGIDVADSNRISSWAVEAANFADAMIVPSNFSRKAYVDSGVKKPVYVVPHGVTEEWIEAPPSYGAHFPKLAKLKEQKGYKIIEGWPIHSPYRKGADLLAKIFSNVVKERRDVVLVVKTLHNVGLIRKPFNYDFGPLEAFFDACLSSKWLSEREKQELYEAADVFILSSRGGGFEHSGLEALARGVPVVAAKGGSWEDYLPEWCLVKSRPSKQVLEGNPIHSGVGIEMLVERAVDKVLEILDNPDDYKARVLEYVDTEVRERFTWGRIGVLLKEIVSKYANK